MVWQTKKLSEVCSSIFAGGDVPKNRLSKFKTEKYSIPIFANGEKDKGLYGYTDEPRVSEPSITVSARGTIGYSEVRYEPFLPVVRLIVLIPNPAQIDLEFLKYVLQGMDFVNSGTSIPQLTVPMIKNYQFFYPSIPEQKRIVAILDEAFADIDRARELTERNLKNARELFDSNLQQVFSQRGENWSQLSLGELGKVSMCKRILKKQTSESGDIPFFKIGTFGNKPDAYIKKETYYEFKQKYSFPKKGDVLISASGTIGRRVIYDGEPAYFQDSNIVWIDNDESVVLNEYLYHFYGICDWNPSKGATISRLYNDDLRAIKISFPSIELQKKCVIEIVALNRQADELQKLYEKKISALLELKKSLLQKAFSGELTKDEKFTSGNIIPFPNKVANISPTDLHAGVLAMAYQAHEANGNVQHFGHVKAEKIAHMTEALVGIELEREPIQDAAGPNDYPHLKKVESRAKKAGFFTFTASEQSGYQLVKGRQFDAIASRTEKALGASGYLSEMQRLIDLMLPMDMAKAEIFATVYAAWNNLLLDNAEINDEAIVLAARENWHESKLTIPRERFFKAIAWIREKRIEPQGKGKYVH